MPDTATLEMPGQSGQSKGIPSWIMLVGAVAGIAGLALLLKGSGGSGTTAAGTSINAALGSIQEENMNLLGTTQAGFMQTNQGLTTGFLNTQQQMGSLGNQIGAGFSQTQGLLGQLEHDITQQLSAYSQQTQTNFNSLNSLIQSGQATQAQVAQAQTALMQSIQQDVQTGLIGQQQANAMLNQTGAFLGWEFYQLPNRYAAYIPAGVSPPGWNS